MSTAYECPGFARAEAASLREPEYQPRRVIDPDAEAASPREPEPPLSTEALRERWIKAMVACSERLAEIERVGAVDDVFQIVRTRTALSEYERAGAAYFSVDPFRGLK